MSNAADDTFYAGMHEYGFSPQQVDFITELMGLAREEWQGDIANAVTMVGDAMGKQREDMAELRGQMSVVTGLKLDGANVVDVPKFIGKPVTKSTPDKTEILLDRMHDLERLVARLAKQVKTVVGRIDSERTSMRAKEAMNAGLIRRVDKLEVAVRRIADEV